MVMLKKLKINDLVIDQIIYPVYFKLDVYFEFLQIIIINQII